MAGQGRGRMSSYLSLNNKTINRVSYNPEVASEVKESCYNDGKCFRSRQRSSCQCGQLSNP